MGEKGKDDKADLDKKKQGRRWRGRGGGGRDMRGRGKRKMRRVDTEDDLVWSSLQL
jgi:hypothetical protein